jgi:hypothetical protein
MFIIEDQDGDQVSFDQVGEYIQVAFETETDVVELDEDDVYLLCVYLYQWIERKRIENAGRAIASKIDGLFGFEGESARGSGS